jgi:hypothetical protein
MQLSLRHWIGGVGLDGQYSACSIFTASLFALPDLATCSFTLCPDCVSGDARLLSSVSLRKWFKRI